MEDCNSCFCGEGGAGCTFKFCGSILPVPVPVPVEASSCQDQGVTREDGEEWVTDNSKPVTKPHGVGDLGIPEKEDTRAGSVSFPSSGGSTEDSVPSPSMGALSLQ